LSLNFRTEFHADHWSLTKMTYRMPIAILALAMTTSSAHAAPSQLYGKSVVVGWTENRIQTTDGSPVPQARTATGQLSVYVSDKGRAFSRVSMSVQTPRGTRSGQRDAVQGEASARSVNFRGNSMTLSAPRGDAGAMMIAVTFDAGFQGCSARVVTGKSGGASSTHVTSMVTGHTYDFLSVKTSNESCSIQSGNVFGN
jgi:hypothetical protein